MECYERYFRRCSTGTVFSPDENIMRLWYLLLPVARSAWLTCRLISERKQLRLHCPSVRARVVPKDIRQKFIATASPVMYVQYDIVFAV